MHAASNAFIGVGAESLWPMLDEEILWLLIYILLMNLLGIWAGWRLNRQAKNGNIGGTLHEAPQDV